MPSAGVAICLFLSATSTSGELRGDRLRSLAPESAGSCGLFAGFLNATNMSAKCCFTTQVVTQRTLSLYGLARECQPTWQCEANGHLPTAEFERMALRDLCAEPGCAPSVAAQMQRSALVSRGATQMSRVCDGSFEAGKAQHEFLLRAHHDPGVHTGEEEHCAGVCTDVSVLDDVPKSQLDAMNDDQKKTRICAKLARGGASCYSHCCDAKSPVGAYGFFDDFGLCLPDSALTQGPDGQRRPLGQLAPGDPVLVQRPSGELAYEPVLAFLHANAWGDVVEVRHEEGVFRASATHFVFAETSQGVEALATARLRPGEHSLRVVAADGSLASSKILAVRSQKSTNAAGQPEPLHTPLTASGTIVVDGVVASTYATPALAVRLTHGVAHAMLLPVLLYHRLGLAAALQPLWRRLCSDSSEGWLCHGGSPASGSGKEQRHPYARLLQAVLPYERILKIIV